MLFLAEARRKSPLLTYGIIGIIVLSLLNHKHRQSQNETIAPFMVWDMYSRNYWEQEYYSFWQIVYNQHQVLNFCSPANALKKGFIYIPLDAYNRVKDGHYMNALDSERQQKFRYLIRHSPARQPLFNNQATVAAFIPWFRQHLEAVTGKHIDSASVYEIKVHFDGSTENTLSKTLLFKTTAP